MKHLFLFIKFTLAATTAVTLAQGQQQNLIVRAAKGQGPTIEANYNLTVVQQLDSAGDVALVSAGDASATLAFITAAQSDPLIRSVEADTQKSLDESDSSSRAQNSVTSNTVDPLVVGSLAPVTYFGSQVAASYANQPVDALIHIPDAQAAYGTGTNTIVAVIDTGIDPFHPALAGNVVSGYDFINNVSGVPSELANLSPSTVNLLDQVVPPQSNIPNVPFVLNGSTIGLIDGSSMALLDPASMALLNQQNLGEGFGHGTMVSGLIHLVAPGAQIMPLRAFQNDGTGNMSNIVQAIYYATDHGAKVINMSFSSTASSPALTAAIQYARSHHVVTVAAAGNSGTGTPVYPASAGAIGVASINAAGVKSFFSNFGESNARTSAPGEALLTSYPGGGYAGVWGTSFSAALVSGTAAIMGQLAPRSSQGDFSDALEHGKRLAGADNMGDASLDVLLVLQNYNTDN